MDKDRFDAISIMYKQAWNNFNERRKYESKISYGIFTVYALTIAGILTQIDKTTINGSTFLWGTILIGGIVLILHCLYLRGAFRANFIDRKIAVHFEGIMQTLSSSEFDIDFKKNFISKSNLSKDKIPFFLATWHPIVLILISLVLYIALILATIIANQ